MLNIQGKDSDLKMISCDMFDTLDESSFSSANDMLMLMPSIAVLKVCGGGRF